MLGCAPLQANTSTPLDAPASPAAAPRAAQAHAFELDIQAPKELQAILAEHLPLKRYRSATDITDTELQRLIYAARQDAQELVATQGYFSPEIQIDLQTKPGSSTRWVRLRLEPGAATLISAVQIQFSGAIASDPLAQEQRQAIQSNWSLPVGMRFTQEAWDKARQTALLLLSKERYLNGRISQSLADIDPSTHSAELSITLDSGPAFTLGSVHISGLVHYDEALVRRLAQLREGASYNQEELVQAQRRLTDSGFFDAAFISLDNSQSSSAAPVQVLVREAKLQKLVLGIGASTDSGTRLSLEHTHRKVPGLNWQALSKLALERTASTLSTELTAPPDAALWRWMTLLQLQSQTLAGEDISSQRWRIGRNQNSQHIERNYYLQYDRSQNADNTATAQSFSANYAWTWRHFDQLLSPSRGWGLGLELGAGSTLGHQRDPYGRLLLRWRGYQPLVHDDDRSSASASRLALRTQFGAVLAQESISLPQSQLFWTGGDTSVRGYAFNSIGATQADGSLGAGRYLLVSSLEWQHPLFFEGHPSDWESTFFIDSGVVSDPRRSLKAQTGIGAGVRWKSPLGPVQIDLAYGMAIEKWRLHLNVGINF